MTSGASARRKGHRFELEVAETVSGMLGLDVVTARSVGHRDGGDLVQVLSRHEGRVARWTPWFEAAKPWVVECKNHRQYRLEEWFAQTSLAAQRYQSHPLLVIKRNRKPSLAVTLLDGIVDRL